MKTYWGLLAIAVALSGGIAACFYTFSKPSTVIAQPAEATPVQEPVKAVEAKRVEPETTGATPREPRIIPITRDAAKNRSQDLAAPKQVSVSSAKTNKEVALERAKHRRAERKARREAKRNHRTAHQERRYPAYGQDEFSAFSYR